MDKTKTTTITGTNNWCVSSSGTIHDYHPFKDKLFSFDEFSLLCMPSQLIHWLLQLVIDAIIAVDFRLVNEKLVTMLFFCHSSYKLNYQIVDILNDFAAVPEQTAIIWFSLNENSFIRIFSLQ